MFIMTASKDWQVNVAGDGPKKADVMVKSLEGMFDKIINIIISSMLKYLNLYVFWA